jgi:hypothetical protein
VKCLIFILLLRRDVRKRILLSGERKIRTRKLIDSMEKKILSIKDRNNLSEEEKKAVLAFYNVSEEQKKTIVESYNGNPEGYKASLEKMPEKEREVSLLIASACGINIKDI